jgi:hypothetical protein
MDCLQSHLSDCECNPAKLPEYMLSREDQELSASCENATSVEGTTSLRMKLFKGQKRDLLSKAASGNMSILGSRDQSIGDVSLPKLSDLTSDLISSSDVIARNRPQVTPTDDFIELSDEED